MESRRARSEIRGSGDDSSGEQKGTFCFFRNAELEGGGKRGAVCRRRAVRVHPANADASWPFRCAVVGVWLNGGSGGAAQARTVDLVRVKHTL